MSITFNMSITQQRFLAFAIKDFITTTSSNPHNNGEPCKPGELDGIISTYVATLSSKAPVTKSRKLSPEQLAERAEANLVRKEERDRLKEEKLIAKNLAKAEARAAKKAAAGPGYTVKEITAESGLIMKGINGCSLRVAKRKDSERGAWPRDTIVMKVPSNWSESDKIEFTRQFGTPFIAASEPTQPKADNMVEILIAANTPNAADPTVEPTVDPTVEPTVEPTTEPVAEPTTAPVAAKPKKSKKSKKDEKSKKRAEKIALIKAKKAKKAMELKAEKAAGFKKAMELKAEAKLKADAELHTAELKAAELKAAGKAVEFKGETKEEMRDSSEDEFSEEDDDLPTEWTHSSYTGDETIFKDSDNGVYRFDDDAEDFEIIGFYYDEAQGDIEKDTLVLD